VSFSRDLLSAVRVPASAPGGLDQSGLAVTTGLGPQLLDAVESNGGQRGGEHGVLLAGTS
jgi:hypothetical protein